MLKLALILQLTAILLFGISSPSHSISSDGNKIQKEKSTFHLECESDLLKMMNMKASLSKIVKKNDLESLRGKLKELEIGLQKVQTNMDNAVLLGAWSSPKLKIESQTLADRLGSLKILNFIGIAFTSPYYSNPTGKVSSSVSDSINKFFDELGSLTNQVSATNQKAKESA